MSRSSKDALRMLGGVIGVAVLLLAGCSSESPSSAPSDSSDPDGGGEGSTEPVTLKLGSFGFKAQLGGAEYGATARIDQFNDF